LWQMAQLRGVTHVLWCYSRHVLTGLHAEFGG
jgi:hypothetical protein